MDVDLEALLPIFHSESEEGLTRMERALLLLEQHPGDAEALDEVFRVTHTLKGDAAALGFRGLSAFAHRLEDSLDVLRSGEAAMSTDLSTCLLRATDAIRARLKAPPESSSSKPTVLETDLLSEIEAFVAAAGPQQGGDAVADRDDSAKRPGGPESEGFVGPPTANAPATLRVDVDALDDLMTLVGEVTVAWSQVLRMLESADHRPSEILERAQTAERSYSELQDLVMKLRMVPVGRVLQSYERTVRDQSLTQGKNVELVLEGTDVELDNSVLQRLREPLLHLVRNALSHGIESPQERIEAGKDPCGRIRLSASRRSGGVWIEVADDGRGLDSSAILERAVAAGMVAPDAGLEERQIHRLVLAPGLTTSGAVDDFSGRGVGMDIVQKRVTGLRGSVDIESGAGAGTTVSIRLPLTLAMIDGLLVRVSGQTFVLPLEMVSESLDLPVGALDPDRATGVLQVRGRALPCVRLASLLGMQDDGAGRQNVVIAELPAFEAGLVVDEVAGRCQAVIKPLPAVLGGVDGLAGSTILGDGELALILDLGELLAKRGPQSGIELAGAGDRSIWVKELSGGSSAFRDV